MKADRLKTPDEILQPYYLKNELTADQYHMVKEAINDARRELIDFMQDKYPQSKELIKELK